MKNKLLLGALLMSIVSLFMACSNDRDSNPTVVSPTTFTVNPPALGEQYIQLSPTNNVNLTWSQPNYGFNAFVTYRVQVGIYDETTGTTKWNERDIKDDAGNVIGTEPVYIDGSFNKCNCDISGEDIAMAICSIDGFTSTDDYVDMGYRVIAMRVHASINRSEKEEVAGTGITSEPVFFKHMAAYCAIKSPAYMYIIGNCNGWPAPVPGAAVELATWRVFETEIGNKLFYGEFDIPAGTLQFRFYKALTDWNGGDSWGTQVDDAGVECAFKDNVFEGVGMAGKGTWLFNDFPGGKVKMTVNMNTEKVKFELE